MATGAEIPGNVIDGTERVEEFTKKRLLSTHYYSNVIEKKKRNRER